MSQVIVRVTLLSGRYHAHPWGEAQHAMGGPEWPPSPWRLLRTIAARWFEAPEPPCTAEQRDALLNALARAEAPTLWLPRASFNELPYYQPVTKPVTRNVGGKRVSFPEVNSRVLHFDHFAVVAAPDVYFVFNVNLTAEQQSLLSLLLSTARYFGRAESRASLQLVPPDCQRPHCYHEARPAGEQKHRSGAIRRHVLVATNEFKADDLWQVRQASSRKAKSRTKATGQQSGSGDHPVHLVEALIAAKKPVPDGTSWVQYELPRAAIVLELPRQLTAKQPPAPQPAAEVVFRLFRRVPILVADTVPLARDFRDQAVRAYMEGAAGRNSVLLSGREDDGSIARGHRHAYYLPRPTRSGGFIEHFVVKLPGGEAGVEQDVLDALLGVTRLLRRDTYPVLVVPEEVRHSVRPRSASCWRSVTPFLGPLQHRRGREQTEPVQQLLRTLQASVNLTPQLKPPSASQIVSVLSHLYDTSGAVGRRHHRFVRRAGLRVDLEFPQPIELPVAVGADAHFGLGQFEPVEEGSGSG
jgi:CRISPR-associated protein Csb2